MKLNDEWYKPWYRRDHSNSEHKSCWDCQFIRIRQMFDRTCAIDPGRSIWGSDPEDESRETGTTRADNCKSFKFDTATGRVTAKDHEAVEKEQKRLGIS